MNIIALEFEKDWIVSSSSTYLHGFAIKQRKTLIAPIKKHPQQAVFVKCHQVPNVECCIRFERDHWSTEFFGYIHVECSNRKLYTS